jgi:hypothetical protein
MQSNMVQKRRESHSDSYFGIIIGWKQFNIRLSTDKFNCNCNKISKITLAVVHLIVEY